MPRTGGAPPGGIPSGAASALTALIAGPFQFGINGPGGWLIVAEPEVHFGADVVVPDLAGWRAERVGDWSDAAYLTLAPDCLCEVVSPSTERIDRTKKPKIYARAGVQCMWLIDPLRKSLEVLRLEGNRWSLSAPGRRRARAEPFDAIELDLDSVWGERLTAP